MTLNDYRRCHWGSTSAFIPFFRPGALLIHMSSAHVLGKSKQRVLGNSATPNPETYPSAAYAIAKYECDRAVERAARERGFRVVFLRPTILYARNGDTSMIDNFCRLAKRGVVARLYPRDARHHLCHLDILRTVACRIVEQRDRMLSGSSLVVADPYTITSRQMEALIRRHLTRKAMTVPVPAPLMSALLLRAPHFKNPKLDIHTWGEIFGVFHLDTVYDPFETFRSLGIDPTQFEMDKTLLPFLQRAFQPESISERTPDTAATPRAA
jgi:nucleoside-diphosphate-sugar epimerase